VAHHQPAKFEAFRDELLSLLDAADERGLATETRDAVKAAALERKTEAELTEPGEDWRRSLGPKGLDLAYRIAGLLADADGEFPERVGELETLVRERLDPG
jgi:hypothetical protein